MATLGTALFIEEQARKFVEAHEEGKLDAEKAIAEMASLIKWTDIFRDQKTKQKAVKATARKAAKPAAEPA